MRIISNVQSETQAMHVNILVQKVGALNGAGFDGQSPTMQFESHERPGIRGVKGRNPQKKRFRLKQSLRIATVSFLLPPIYNASLTKPVIFSSISLSLRPSTCRSALKS